MVTQYYSLFEDLIWRILFEDGLHCFKSVRVISNNDLEFQQNHSGKEVHMEPFEEQNKCLGQPMRWCLNGDLDNNKLVPLGI